MYKLMSLDGRITCVNKIYGETIMSIPFAVDNSDYQQFLKDIKEGVELLDADGNVVTDFLPQER